VNKIEKFYKKQIAFYIKEAVRIEKKMINYV
jgi:hypothetical protein